MGSYFDYFNDLFVRVWQWAEDTAVQIIDVLYSIYYALDPRNVLSGVILWITPLLPDAVDLSSLTNSLNSVLDTIDIYLQTLDYFVNMPIFMLVMSIILGIESGLVAVRAIRFFRSFVS